MDGDRFDMLTKRLAQGRSRRRVLKALGATALGAVGLSKLGSVEAAKGGNSACAHFCAAVFPPGPARGQCVSDAAHGAGPCVACGADPNRYCNRTCVDLTSDAANCGACGVSCNDHNACTIDACVSGACVYTPIALTCVASDQCHVAGACDPSTGQCTNPAKPDGAPCDDANACTQTDTCQSGVCVGSNPVVCKAPDQCHLPGVCQSASGQCAYRDQPNGSVCDDGNACTQTDTCQSGVCVGGDPVPCPAPNACQVSVACDPMTGQCVAQNQADGTLCGTDAPCSHDICQAGRCATNVPKPVGTACNDYNACTRTDACDGNGACVGGNPVTCPPPSTDICHDAGVCDPSSGHCGPNPVTAGTCFIGGVCYAAGQPNPSNPCQVCNPIQSQTTFSNGNEGGACDDKNACTQTDTCQAGQCVGSNPVVCQPLDQCHVAGTCNPATGSCSNPNQADGVACDDKNACTQTDACQAGQCVGGNPIICPAPDRCHTAGTCDPSTGTCSNPPAPPNTICAAPSCANGTLTTSACDSAGSCVTHQTSCSPYACNSTATACRTACAMDADCAAGDYCTGGTCVAKQGGGAACFAGDQCLSGNCVGGFCCASATCGACESCASGTCAASCAAGQTCHFNSCCTPESSTTTCQGQPGQRSPQCGLVTNNCGQSVDCGGCTGSNTCGGGGTPNVCGCASCASSGLQYCADGAPHSIGGCCNSGPGNYSCSFGLSPNVACCTGVCIEVRGPYGSYGQCT